MSRIPPQTWQWHRMKIGETLKAKDLPYAVEEGDLIAKTRMAHIVYDRKICRQKMINGFDPIYEKRGEVEWTKVEKCKSFLTDDFINLVDKLGYVPCQDCIDRLWLMSLRYKEVQNNGLGRIF